MNRDEALPPPPSADPAAVHLADLEAKLARREIDSVQIDELTAQERAYLKDGELQAGHADRHAVHLRMAREQRMVHRSLSTTGAPVPERLRFDVDGILTTTLIDR